LVNAVLGGGVLDEEEEEEPPPHEIPIITRGKIILSVLSILRIPPIERYHYLCSLLNVNFYMKPVKK
jgi:hypothetical protein